MVNRSHPLRLRQWASLRMRNGDNRHIGKPVIKGRQIGQIEPAVQCGYLSKRSATRQREVKVVDMEMNDVELVGAPKNLLQQENMMSKCVCRLAPIAMIADRSESGGRLSWNRRWRKV